MGDEGRSVSKTKRARVGKKKKNASMRNNNSNELRPKLERTQRRTARTIGQGDNRRSSGRIIPKQPTDGRANRSARREAHHQAALPPLAVDKYKVTKAPSRETSGRR